MPLTPSWALKLHCGYLGPLRLPFLQRSSKLLVGPRSCWTPDNELADSLAKTRAIFPFAHVSSQLAPVIAKIRHTRYAAWRRNLSYNSVICQIPSVSSKALRRVIFGTTSSSFDLWSRPWGVARLWVFAEFFRSPIPRKGSGSSTTTTTSSHYSIK